MNLTAIQVMSNDQAPGLVPIFKDNPTEVLSAGIG